MGKWLKTCKEFAEVRKAIENEEMSKILQGIYNICDKYSKQKWNFAEDFDNLKEEISVELDEDVDGDTVDYWLDEFYDLCDIARVWLEI